MRIDWLKDVGVPVAVGGAAIGLSYWDEKRLAVDPAAMRYQPLLGVVAAVGGIGMMMGNMATDYAQPMAHAALPMATQSIYGWIKEAMATAGTTSARRVARAGTVGRIARPRGVTYGFPNQDSLVPEFQGQRPAY